MRYNRGSYRGGRSGFDGERFSLDGGPSSVHSINERKKTNNNNYDYALAA